jgi:hypothetical protein
MPDELIAPLVAARMIFPFDLPAIRAELARMLSRPNCADFVRDLIARVSESAMPGNDLVEDGDLLKIFDVILSQRGFIRSGDTARGAQPGANFALGSIGVGNAAIQIGNIMPGVPVTLAELTAMYVQSDARFALHELIHHAGTLLYSDQDLAIVVSAMPGSPPLPTPSAPPDPLRDRFLFSRYWDRELRRRCR